MKRIAFLLVTTVLIFSGCKHNNDDSPTVAEGARDDLYELMQSDYLWNSQMPEVDTKNYSDPYELLEALRYSPTDKWSFVSDYDAFIAEMSGSFVGHGIRIGLDEDKNARIATIYNGSDLYSKGVRRGWIIKTINGTALAPILIQGDATAYNNLMGESKAGVTNTFVFQRPDGVDVTISSAKASFTLNTVLKADTLHLTSGITGYLAFDSFLSVSSEELKTAFSYFKSCGIKDIIVDLRYNTGGYVNVAQELSSYIMGNDNTTKDWIKVCYNQTLSTSQNKTYNFINTDYPIGLSKAVFITTRSSASASEVVISSLMPYLDVKIVGDTTYGKPCGMDLYQYKYTYVFAPITFEYKNANDFGEFYNGIPQNYEASDDITHDFGDRKEASLSVAIAVLEGRTTKASMGEAMHPEIFNENRKSLTNLFINNLKH